jgi:hypothetical protein
MATVRGPYKLIPRYKLNKYLLKITSDMKMLGKSIYVAPQCWIEGLYRKPFIVAYLSNLDSRREITGRGHGKPSATKKDQRVCFDCTKQPCRKACA